LPVPVPAASSAATASPAAGPAVGRRELLLILVAAAGVALVAFALLMSRAAPSAEVSAAQVPASAPRPSPVAAPQSPSRATVKWSSANAGVWVGNRRNAAAFELPAENTVAVWMRQVRPALIVRCMASSMHVFVLTGSAMQMERETEDHTVTFRFDDEPERTERWTDAAEHDALFAPDGAAFADRLSRARTFRFGYTPHNAPPVTAHFMVSGLGELIAPLGRQCGRKK
jgi:hypothetical protein